MKKNRQTKNQYPNQHKLKCWVGRTHVSQLSFHTNRSIQMPM